MLERCLKMLSRLAVGLVVLSALAHIYFMYRELFAVPDLAAELLKIEFADPLSETDKAIRKLVWNQGVYNGFLVAGLLLSFMQSALAAWQTRLVVSACILVAGVFGVATVHYFLAVQIVLGGATFVAMFLSGPDREA